MTDVRFYLLLAVSLASGLVSLAALLRRSAAHSQAEQLRREVAEELRATRTELVAALNGGLQSYGQTQAQALQQIARLQDDRLQGLDERFKDLSVQTELQLAGVRRSVENRLTALQQDNAAQLGQIRSTVEEKLQRTLEERLAKSFGLVSGQLEQVYKGLGEMQALAVGVGDLKKVLSNVKTRGTLGEVQLGAILKELLTPGQYEENVATKKGAAERVEFALRLPNGPAGGPLYLPIDAKFPADCYADLMDAYDSGDAARVEAAGKLLENRLRSEAKDIHEKYIQPPYTTEFGILFLPVEGLYAEAVRRGMIERLQREYRVNLAGPSTMAALLNSLQMGFRTLAIQKRSGEVWQLLSGVKAEFENFGRALAQAQNRLHQASDELENLVGVRTRQLQRRLQKVADTPFEEPLPPAAPPESGAPAQEEGEGAPALSARQGSR